MSSLVALSVSIAVLGGVATALCLGAVIWNSSNLDCVYCMGLLFCRRR